MASVGVRELMQRASARDGPGDRELAEGLRLRAAARATYPELGIERQSEEALFATAAAPPVR